MVKTTVKNIKGKVCKSKKCKDNADCKFPFTYKKKEYNQCINSEDGPWCAVTTNAKGFFRNSDDWGYCVEDKKEIKKLSSKDISNEESEDQERFNRDFYNEYWAIDTKNYSDPPPNKEQLKKRRSMIDEIYETYDKLVKIDPEALSPDEWRYPPKYCYEQQLIDNLKGIKEELSSVEKSLSPLEDKETITELYVNGTKFWEITYNKVGDYTVRFGKVGSEGRTTNKKDTIKNIEKLIQSKKNKGYKLEKEKTIENVPIKNDEIDTQLKEFEDVELQKALELSRQQELLEEQRKLKEQQDREYEEALKIDIQRQQEKEKKETPEKEIDNNNEKLTIQQLREARIKTLEKLHKKESSSNEKTHCEKNIEKNVINKFEKGNLYVKKKKVETEEQAQHIVDSLQKKFCKNKQTKKKSSSHSSSSQKKSHKKKVDKLDESEGKGEDIGNSLPNYLLEFKEGSSNKFYKIQLKSDNSVDIIFGKIGTKGRSQNIDTFDTKEKAIDYINKQVKKKEGKGYINIELDYTNHKSENSKEKVSSSKNTIKSKSDSIIKKSVKKIQGGVIFTKTPMLADKFYDPNVDMEFKETGTYNKKKWVIFDGDSGERIGHRWIFRDTPTLYATDPKNYFISEKFDGVRSVWNGQNFTSRTKNIYHAPEWFKELLPSDHALDGELHCGRGCFQKASGITRHLEPNHEDWTTIKYQVFDIPDPDLVDKPFSERIEIYEKVVKECCQKWDSIKLPPGIKKPTECPIEIAKQILIPGMDEAYKIYKSYIEKGAEGAMLRPSNSIYEYKRSKLLLKWKPSLDAEAIVIGYNEGAGRLKGKLGTFQVQLINDVTKKVEKGKEFSLSGRLTDEFRNQYKFKDGKLIQAPEKNDEYPIIGDKVTLTFMEYTDKGIPRQPIFQRIRNEK